MRPRQTHLVLIGRLRHSGYLTAEGTIVSYTGEVLARIRAGVWTRPVRERPEPAPCDTDLITPRGPAVVVVLTKGRCY